MAQQSPLLVRMTAEGVGPPNLAGGGELRGRTEAVEGVPYAARSGANDDWRGAATASCGGSIRSIVALVVGGSLVVDSGALLHSHLFFFVVIPLLATFILLTVVFSALPLLRRRLCLRDERGDANAAVIVNIAGGIVAALGRQRVEGGAGVADRRFEHSCSGREL